MANILIRLRILINFKHIKLCLVMQQRCLGLVYSLAFLAKSISGRLL